MRDAREQRPLLLLALALVSITGRLSLTALAISYAVAWLAINLVRAIRPSWLRFSLTRAQAIAIALAISIPSVVLLARGFSDLVRAEELESIDGETRARLEIEMTPSIFPSLVSGDRPQTFYLHSPGGESAHVSFGGRRIDARALGHGLFRAQYDPRAHGAPPDGDFRASIEIDGARTERAMFGVTPHAHPRWLSPSPDRTRAVAVSEETDRIFVIDRRGLVREIEALDGPSDAIFVDDRTIAVVHRYARELIFVDADDGRVVRRKRIGFFAARIAIDPSGARIAIAMEGERPALVLLRARDGAMLARAETPFVPDRIVLADSATLIASSVLPPALHRLRLEGNTLAPDLPPLVLGRPAVALARSTDGSHAILSVTDLSEGGAHVGNHFVQDQLVTIDLARFEIESRRMTAIRTARQESPGSVDRGVSPIGIDLDAEGNTLVAFAGTDEVWRIPPEGEPRVHPLDDHPLAAPCSAVALAGGFFAVSSPSYGAIGVFDRRGERVALVRLAPSDRELIRRDQRALQRRIGERTFYESTRAGVACQSCHLHGASDGSRHNIGGYELIATLDVRGARGTPPYLRDGEYPSLGSFVRLADTLYRGYRRHQGGREVSLERYLESLPRPTPARQLEGRDLARERRGADAFVRARCTLCHTFPAFTNLGQHPIASVFPGLEHDGYVLDTPSLLGAGRSAPYLVDGRADTLRSIFAEHDRARRHGDIARLTEQERGDLLDFVLGL